MFPSVTRRNTVILFLALLLVVIAVGAFFFLKPKNAPQSEQADRIDNVSLQKVGDLAHQQHFSTVGTVSSISQAELQTEAGGRITSVPVTLGSHVAAGTVIATIEGSTQQAALLQAEGSYDAARAAAASSNVGVGAAQNGLDSAYTSGIDTYKKAFITIDTVLHSDIDDVFTSKNGIYNGLRIDGRGQAPVYDETRNTLETDLASWKSETNTVNKESVLDDLAKAIAYTQRVQDLAQKLNSLVDMQDVTSEFSASDKAALQLEFSTDRAAINGALQSLSGARTAINAAEASYQQASIAGSGNDASAAAAQVKIALGALSAAKANYEKTIVRSPIFGTVNALYLKEGDYVNPSQPAAIIANNNGFEITTAVAENESAKLSVGDTVSIEGDATGTITAIAPAVDPQSGKVTLKIGIENPGTLINGSTVSITFTQKSNNESSSTSVFNIPLTALKITASGPVAFEVSPEETLTAVPVTLGMVTGDFVAVTGGLTADMEIVTDARGLKAGERVTITK